MAFFELVNLCTGNRVGDYDTDREALLDAWRAVQRGDASVLNSIALRREEDDGSGCIIAESDDLVRMAEQAHRGTIPA